MGSWMARVIAEVLFSRKRIPGRAWKTHELRSRTIRLVQAGLALMRGGIPHLAGSRAGVPKTIGPSSASP
ncbi:DUF2285 domain-containing protein [Bradyrhizobium sp. 191]|uniref:DNA -binding domain-containing protein n=1 Tax=Bradyrhizobium sp. 191 TaxID=2782659 RepID=UPI003208B801